MSTLTDIMTSVEKGHIDRGQHIEKKYQTNEHHTTQHTIVIQILQSSIFYVVKRTQCYLCQTSTDNKSVYFNRRNIFTYKILFTQLINVLHVNQHTKQSTIFWIWLIQWNQLTHFSCKNSKNITLPSSWILYFVLVEFSSSWIPCVIPPSVLTIFEPAKCAEGLHMSPVIRSGLKYLMSITPVRFLSRTGMCDGETWLQSDGVLKSASNICLFSGFYSNLSPYEVSRHPGEHL